MVTMEPCVTDCHVGKSQRLLEQVECDSDHVFRLCLAFILYRAIVLPNGIFTNRIRLSPAARPFALKKRALQQVELIERPRSSSGSRKIKYSKQQKQLSLHTKGRARAINCYLIQSI